MRQHQSEFEEVDLRFAVVTFETRFFVEAYRRDTGAEWPILIDNSLELYTAYGMERGSARRIFGLRAWWTYLKLLLRGRRLRKSEGDVYQLGGDVLVDPAGIVRLHHVGQDPSDRPPVESILDCVRAHGATGRSSRVDD